MLSLLYRKNQAHLSLPAFVLQTRQHLPTLHLLRRWFLWLNHRLTVFSRVVYTFHCSKNTPKESRQNFWRCRTVRHCFFTSGEQYFIVNTANCPDVSLLVFLLNDACSKRIQINRTRRANTVVLRVTTVGGKRLPMLQICIRWQWWAVRVHWCWPFACVPINHHCLHFSLLLCFLLNTALPIGNCFTHYSAHQRLQQQQQQQLSWPSQYKLYSFGTATGD